MSGLDYREKLELELGVSMDDLVSDEDVNDIQIKYGIWRSEKIKSRLKLQEERKKCRIFGNYR